MAMPNIAAEWSDRLEKRGLPGKKILKTYMDELRAAKIEIVREWDKN